MTKNPNPPFAIEIARILIEVEICRQKKQAKAATSSKQKSEKQAGEQPPHSDRRSENSE
jgi:hypothetical protein